jgi:hypothetical protein
MRISTFMAVAALGLVLVAASAVRTQAGPVQSVGQQKVAADPISGEWEGAVEMPDSPMPFNLKLKLDGEKVTGEVGSNQGSVAISSGSFIDGKLTVAFTYVDGNGVVLTGAVADGQLAGSLNYGSGQMVTNWSAKKKAK